MRSVKTTLLGLPAFLTGLTAVAQCIADGVRTGQMDTACFIAAFSGMTTGLGLMFAKDHNVTGA